MTKLKIAFFAEILIEDFDGASRTMHQLLDRIPKDKFEFLFFCAVPPKADLGYEIVQLPSTRIPMNKTYRAVFPYFSKNKITKKLDEFQPDIIHIASPSPLGKVAVNYAKRTDTPIISIYHTHFIKYVKYYLRKVPKLIDYFTNKIITKTNEFYKDIDLIYVPSTQVIDELQKLAKLKPNQLKLWQRGLDRKMFNPGKKNKAFITNITKNNHPTILFASRLVWEKNLKTLIGLYRLCQKQNLPYNFIIAGDGIAKNELMVKMPNAHFLGAISHDKLSTVYASCDVHFFPSDTESFGNVVIEAMASGLPCVVANGGGPMGYIQQGVNGFLVDAFKPERYLEKIQLILSDNNLREQMILKGLEFTNDLDWENLVNVYFDDVTNLAKRTAEVPIPKAIQWTTTTI